MKVLFTICSNNYLAQALVLAASAKKFEPSWKFILGLVDAKADNIPYASFGFDVLEIAVIEPDVDKLAEKYSIVELNTCVKPTYASWFFDKLGATEVVYMDPDTCLFQPMTGLDDHFETADILLTPHVLTPVPLDGRSLGENLFLNYGLYNLGFLAMKRSGETDRFLGWWKERTYSSGHNKPAIGLYTDQLWINLVPVYFQRVALIRHPGYNMGPWNLHERTLLPPEGNFRLDSGVPLVFYHFSGFRPAKGGSAGQMLNSDEALYQMQHRGDLYPLYQAYKDKLMAADHPFYSSQPCHYAAFHDRLMARQEQLRQIAEREALPPFHKRCIRKIRRILHAQWNKISFHPAKKLSA
ncbi:MAG TPA: hypothetical protein VK563_09570 [Puia sp.]|nr:hypothetical protein [Puia sp.]